MPAKKSSKNFRLTKLAAAVRTALPLVAIGAIAVDVPVYAQGAGNAGQTGNGQPGSSQTLEEVVVSGVRQSLQSAQDIKQFSNVVVDSVSAEDIGALADRSVTEALQRVPGVAINRFAAGRDPDHFSVEGSGVVVRGLSYVRSEVNGRDSFTANNGRGLSFADVPPELLAGVDVYKTLSADRVEGGIAGSVNLRTRKPFDTEGSLFAFSLEENYSDFIEETTPTGSVLASTRWDTPVGEFGLLGSFVYSQVKSRADRFQISNFAERTLYNTTGSTTEGDVIDTGNGETAVKQVYFPRGAVAGTQEFDRERYGYSAALQWSSPNEDMEATFQFLRSDSREAWTENTIEIATDVVRDQGDSRALPGTTLTFDSSGIFDHGYITAPTGWRDDQNPPADPLASYDPRTPLTGLQSNNIHRGVDQKFVTDDYSLNFLWNVTDDWALKFDYQHVKSTVDNLDAGIWVSTFQDAFIDLNGSEIPTVRFQAPTVCTGTPSSTCSTYYRAGNDSFEDPYNSFYRAAMDHIEASEGTSDAFRVDAEKTFDHEWLQSMDFGYRHANRDQTARFSTYNWGSLSEIWGSGGPVWLDDPAAPQNIEPFNFDNFMDGATSNPLVDEGRLYYAGNPAENYADYVAYAKQITALWPSSSWQPLAERPGVVAGTPFLPGEINPVEETNDAAYFMVEFGNDLTNGWNLSGNVGVRYTDTHREATGFQVFNQQDDFQTEGECASVPPDQDPPLFCTLPFEVREAARAYANGAMTPIKAELDYDFWLPSLNLKLEVGDGMQFRFGYFKGVAAPDFGLTRAYYNINLQTNQEDLDAGGGLPVGRFNAGNPYLLPVEADNYDLTFEWYFSEVGQFSVALFDKTLENIRTNDVQRQTFTNNGATFDAIVTTAVNSKEEGKIKGYELSYQQTYDFLPGWLGNFGLSANYTYVDSSNVPQSTLSETDPDVAAGNQSTIDLSLLPLEGLSKHTINFAPFYETDKWSARLAYTWRDEFLLTIRDVIVPFQPIVNEATGQLDGSVFYSINDNLKIGIQGVNLTNETLRTSAIINDDLRQAPRSWYKNDRRYSLIVRGTFD